MIRLLSFLTRLLVEISVIVLLVLAQSVLPNIRMVVFPLVSGEVVGTVSPFMERKL